MRCPSCHGHIHLDTMIQDHGSKLLLASICKLSFRLTSGLIGYIALFRPQKSDLNNERAASLIGEVLKLSTNEDILISALEQTTLSIRDKRQQGTAKPLKNHNYLKEVVATISAKHTVVKSTEKKSHAVIINQGIQETAEENKQKFQEQLNKYNR